MLQMTQLGEQSDIAKMTQLLGTLEAAQRAPYTSALARRVRAEAYQLEHPEVGFTYQAMLERIKKAETPKELEVMDAQIKRMETQGDLDSARAKSIRSMIDVEKRLKLIQGDVMKVSTASDVMKTLKEIEQIDEKIRTSKELLPNEVEYLKDRSEYLKAQVGEIEELTPERKKLLAAQARYYDAMALAQKYKEKGRGSLTNAEWLNYQKYRDKLATNLASNDVSDEIKKVLAPSWNRMSDEDYIWALGPEEQGFLRSGRKLVKIDLPSVNDPVTGGSRRVMAWEVYAAANDPNAWNPLTQSRGFNGDMIAVISAITGKGLPGYSTPPELGARQESMAWEVLKDR